MVYQKGKLGRYMLIGGAIGAAISLFDRNTRKSLRHNMAQLGKSSFNMYKDVKNNPRQISDRFRQAAINIRSTADELSTDLQQMVDKVDGARRSGAQAYRYAMEAGSELTEMAQKLKTTGQSFRALPPSTTVQSIELQPETMVSSEPVDFVPETTVQSEPMGVGSVSTEPDTLVDWDTEPTVGTGSVDSKSDTTSNYNTPNKPF